MGQEHGVFWCQLGGMSASCCFLSACIQHSKAFTLSCCLLVQTKRSNFCRSSKASEVFFLYIKTVPFSNENKTRISFPCSESHQYEKQLIFYQHFGVSPYYTCLRSVYQPLPIILALFPLCCLICLELFTSGH